MGTLAERKGIYKDVLMLMPRLIFAWSPRSPRRNVCSPSLALLMSQIHFVCMTSIKILNQTKLTCKAERAASRSLLGMMRSNCWVMVAPDSIRREITHGCSCFQRQDIWWSFNLLQIHRNGKHHDINTSDNYTNCNLCANIGGLQFGVSLHPTGVLNLQEI